MATATLVPRINNNDDFVKLVERKVDIGEPVSRGQVIAAVETDKAVVDVEAASDGYLIAWRSEIDEQAQVGHVLAWIGTSRDEAPPAEATQAPEASPAAVAGRPTAKARALLETLGLRTDQVPASGDRITVADVERYAAAQGLKLDAAEEATPRAARAESRPETEGRLQPLSADRRGMVQTVSWHRDEAVPGYLEVPFDGAPWDAKAKEFQSAHGLLMNPLLPLIARRLVTLAIERPLVNATLVGDQRWEYTQVNLGFTVQVGDVLYLTVTRGAQAMDELGFVQHLVDVQRRAAAHNLGWQETQGATIGFSSMARWKVGRHVPVLAPHTSLMVAHAADASGNAVLGATYDHRVLHGADVVGLLRQLARPA